MKNKKIAALGLTMTFILGVTACGSSNNNANVIHKLFREYDLEFHPLMVCDTYVYLSKEHPLAEEKRTVGRGFKRLSICFF